MPKTSLKEENKQTLCRISVIWIQISSQFRKSWRESWQKFYQKLYLTFFFDAVHVERYDCNPTWKWQFCS